MRKIILFSLSLFFALNISAQERPERPERSGRPERPERAERPERPERKKLTPKEIAEKKADMLQDQLTLNDKQRKKVYKLYLNEERNKLAPTSQNRPQFDGPPGGGGFGMPPMGDMQGPPLMGMRGEGPDGMERPGEQESEEDIASRNKKMKKILTEDQFTQWMDMENKRRERDFQDKLLLDFQ